MGVYIDMEMPKSCRDCRFCNGQANTDYGVCAWCDVDGKARDVYTMQDCPLVPVPPHGDLIDRDALKASLAFAEKTAEWAVPALRAVLMVIDEMPTVIPAEEQSGNSGELED